eukprot:5457162-Ditylum_brightwellii.AAC.1
MLHNQHTEWLQGHPQESADYQGPNVFVTTQSHAVDTFPYQLETSEGATSEGDIVYCTSRFGLVPKELAD